MVRRLASAVAFVTLVGQGCAGNVVERELPGEVPGRLSILKGAAGIVIGAPHGTSDPETDGISVELARRTGFGLVVASGYRRPTPGHRRLNVNRPTEGAVGGPPGAEVATEEARLVYEAYVAGVREAAQGPLRLYVEVHGNARKESAGRIEIATLGMTPDEAWRLKTLFQLIRDARVGEDAGVPRLEVLVEPLDRITLTASVAKQVGILRLPERAIHIELPRAARTTGREAYTAVIAEFLREISPVLLGGN